MHEPLEVDLEGAEANNKEAAGALTREGKGLEARMAPEEVGATPGSGTPQEEAEKEEEDNSMGTEEVAEQVEEVPV